MDLCSEVIDQEPNHASVSLSAWSSSSSIWLERKRVSLMPLASRSSPSISARVSATCCVICTKAARPSASTTPSSSFSHRASGARLSSHAEYQGAASLYASTCGPLGSPLSLSGSYSARMPPATSSGVHGGGAPGALSARGGGPAGGWRRQQGTQMLRISSPPRTSATAVHSSSFQ